MQFNITGFAKKSDLYLPYMALVSRSCMPRDARYSGKMAALTDGLCILFTQLEYEKIKRENYRVCEFGSRVS